MWGFINSNAAGITAVTSVLALLGSAFGVYYRGKFKTARKRADDAYVSLEDLKSEISSLSKRLGDAKNEINRYSPDYFLQRITIFKDSASSEDLQNAASAYFSQQNQAITTAAGYLAEKALLNEAEDGTAALHEAKRWLTLGLAATPRNQQQNELMAEIDDRLNALDLGLPEAVVIDAHLDLAGHIKTSDGFEQSGRYSEAESLLASALKIVQNALGKNHMEVTRHLNSLGVLLSKVGKTDEAEALLKQALKIRSAALGEDHPDYATSINSLATLLMITNRSDQAEPLFRQALEIRRTALGEDHPDYANSLNNLATLLFNINKADEAEPLFQRAVTILENSLGPDHPRTKVAKQNLAELPPKTS